MQLGLDPARQTELGKGKKARHCVRYNPAILILFKREGWSQRANDWLTGGCSLHTPGAS